MHNRALGVLASAAVFALAFAGAASAGLASEESNIKFKPTSNPAKLVYKGKIKSDNADCVEGRIISFKANGKRLAKTETRASGKFKVKGKRPESGTKIAIKVKPKGGECPKLTGSGIAP